MFKNQDKLQEVKQLLKELGDEQLGLTSQELSLKKAYRELVQDAYKNMVGRCYLRETEKSEKIYFRIIDVPRETYTLNAVTFNEYQVPALFIYPFPKTTEHTTFQEYLGELLDCVSCETVFYRELPEVPQGEREQRGLTIKKAKPISSDEFFQAYKAWTGRVLEAFMSGSAAAIDPTAN